MYLQNKEQRQRDLTKPKSSFTNSYPITGPFNLKSYTNPKPTNAIPLMDLTSHYQPSPPHQQPTNPLQTIVHQLHAVAVMKLVTTLRNAL